jgi:hypothetical protein
VWIRHSRYVETILEGCLTDSVILFCSFIIFVFNHYMAFPGWFKALMKLDQIKGSVVSDGVVGRISSALGFD